MSGLILRAELIAKLVHLQTAQKLKKESDRVYTVQTLRWNIAANFRATAAFSRPRSSLYKKQPNWLSGKALHTCI